MSPSRTTENEDSDDPVIAEYNVFITPRQLEQIYLLQYPNRNRSQAYNERNGASPSDFRLKPNAGFVEMDINMNPSANFNKYQSLVWGEAMRKIKSGSNNASGTFGAAGGFAPPKGTKGRGGRQEEQGQSLDGGLNRFAEAINTDRVFLKQTLGGQILKDETGNPNYMLGAFRGNELHLTPVDGVVQMRPQFHHVDAITHAETLTRRANEATDDSTSGTAAKAQPKPQSLAQTYKDSRDAENPDAQKAKNLLTIAMEEKWMRLEYFDEDEEQSYETYHDRLFTKDTETAPSLKSEMSNEQYLDAISAPRVDPSGRRKKKPLTKRQMEKIEAAEDDVEVGGDVEGEGLE